MRLFTDSILLTRMIVRAAAADGVSPEELLAFVKLDPETLENVEGRVPSWLHLNLLNHAAGLTGDPHFGLRAGTAMEMNAPNALHYLFFNSANLRQGIRGCSGYNRLMSNAGSLRLTEKNGLATLTIRPYIPLPVQPRQPVEWGLAMIATMIRSVAPVGFRFREARFQHAAPGPDHGPYERVFEAPVRFRQRHSELAFDSGWLDQPCPNHNPVLQPVLERMAEYQLRRVFHDDMVEAVRSEIQHTIATESVRMEDVCARLGMERRTLQRRLSAQGTSYKELLDGVRRELVETYFREEGLSLGDASVLLGFASPDAFYRAFRRWHGTTPAEYRRGLLSTAVELDVPQRSS